MSKLKASQRNKNSINIIQNTKTNIIYIVKVSLIQHIKHYILYEQ